MTVLIVASEVDPHLPSVEHELERRGARWTFLNMNRLHRWGISVALDRRAALRGTVRTGQGITPLKDIESVWAPSPLPEASLRGISVLEKAVIESEWLSTVQNLYYLTSDRTWVNPLDAEMLGSSKLVQLRIAHDVGFEIPPTIVTTEREEFAAFADQFPSGVASKRVGGLPGLIAVPRRVRRRRAYFTRRLSSQDMTPEVLSRLHYCPTQLQEYVPKSTEWRIYVVGDKVFGAEILSQLEDETVTDWRRYPVRYTADGSPELDSDRWRCHPLRLPLTFADRCRRLARKLRLPYTAMDFVRTPDGRLVFLEANFGGTFAWIEDLTHLPMSAAMADLLLA